MKSSKKKTFWKYLTGIGSIAVLSSAVVAGVVSCSNGSSSTSSTTNTNNATSSISNSNTEKSSSTTNNNSNDDKTTSTPKTTTDYALEKGANQPGLQYTNNAISSTSTFAATASPTISNKAGDLDVYAGGGLSAIITPSEIVSGETINLTLNLLPSFADLTYSELLTLPSLITILPYQSTAKTYSINEKDSNSPSISFPVTTPFAIQFLPETKKWLTQYDIVQGNAQGMEFLLGFNNGNDCFSFDNTYENVYNGNYMASAPLIFDYNGTEIHINLAANLKPFFTFMSTNNAPYEILCRDLPPRIAPDGNPVPKSDVGLLYLLYDLQNSEYTPSWFWYNQTVDNLTISGFVNTALYQKCPFNLASSTELYPLTIIAPNLANNTYIILKGSIKLVTQME